MTEEPQSIQAFIAIGKDNHLNPHFIDNDPTMIDFPDYKIRRVQITLLPDTIDEETTTNEDSTSHE